MKIRLKEERVASVVCFFARLLFRTIRLDLDDRAGFTTRPPEEPVLITFWHNRILAITLCYLRTYHPSRKGVAVLTSPSYDGRLLAAVARGFGMEAVFGSSNKRAVSSVRESAEVLEAGKDIAVTPDGPRGPKYELGPGVIYLAGKRRAPILPVHASFSKAWTLKTWDGFRIPFPFSRISVRIDPYEFIPETDSDEAFERERIRIQELLRHEAD